MLLDKAWLSKQVLKFSQPLSNLLGVVWKTLKLFGQVTKIENIKTDLPKILRPTHFSGPKDIKTDKVSFDLIPGTFFNMSSRS